jgi:hypothetical protein
MDEHRLVGLITVYTECQKAPNVMMIWRVATIN